VRVARLSPGLGDAPLRAAVEAPRMLLSATRRAVLYWFGERRKSSLVPARGGEAETDRRAATAACSRGRARTRAPAQARSRVLRLRVRHRAGKAARAMPDVPVTRWVGPRSMAAVPPLTASAA
jgi:hypothetical protein